ncbi:g5417 [Coccomyxa elongata]
MTAAGRGHAAAEVAVVSPRSHQTCGLQQSVLIQHHGYPGIINLVIKRFTEHAGLRSTPVQLKSWQASCKRWRGQLCCYIWSS